LPWQSDVEKEGDRTGIEDRQLVDHVRTSKEPLES